MTFLVTYRSNVTIQRTFFKVRSAVRSFPYLIKSISIPLCYSPLIKPISIYLPLLFSPDEAYIYTPLILRLLLFSPDKAYVLFPCFTLP